MRDTAPVPQQNDEIEYNRGWYFPASVIRLYEDDIINAEQMMFLGILNSLCHPRRGCFATNAYLARRWGKSTKHVSQTIGFLADQGLIKIVEQTVKEPRTIWTLYQGDSIYDRQGQTPTPKGNGPLYQNVERNGTRLSKPGANCARGRSLGVTGKDAFVEECQHRLENLLRKKRKIDPKVEINKRRWYNEMRRLLHQDLNGDRKRLENVLKTYCNVEHNRFTPQVFNSWTFRQKFESIEAWIERLDPSERPYEPKIIEIIRDK